MKSYLTLAGRYREAEGVDSLRLRPETPLAFQAGQYLRYTLNHPDPDERGVSRFFTISSAPSEGCIMLTTRLGSPGSTFKQALGRLEEGAVIEAAGPYGKFVYTQHEVSEVYIAGVPG